MQSETDYHRVCWLLDSDSAVTSSVSFKLYNVIIGPGPNSRWVGVDWRNRRTWRMQQCNSWHSCIITFVNNSVRLGHGWIPVILPTRPIENKRPMQMHTSQSECGRFGRPIQNSRNVHVPLLPSLSEPRHVHENREKRKYYGRIKTSTYVVQRMSSETSIHIVTYFR